MIVDCENCHTKFKLADEKVTARGVKIRCSKCAHIFVVRKDVAEELAAPAAPPKAPGGAAAGPMGNNNRGVDELEAMFGPSKRAPKPAPPAPKPAPKAAPPKRAAEADPFGDAMTLDTGAGQPAPGRSPAREGAKGDPFGGLFESTSDSSSRNAASLETRGDGEASDSGGEDFNDILTGGGPSARPARGAPREEDALGGGGEGGEDAPSSETLASSPSVQWGPRKAATAKGGATGESSPVPKIVALVAALVLLPIGIRGALEFAPQSFLDMGIQYETLAGLRKAIPFFAENPAFPKPQTFWEAEVDRTFVVNHQSGKRFFVAVGHVTNKGPGKRSFFALTVQAFDAAGEPMGPPQKTYAGNEMDVDALSRVAEPHIHETLGNKLGAGGANFEVPPGKSLPFNAVFFDLPRDAAGAKVTTVDAVAAGG